MADSDALLICTACGTHFSTSNRASLKPCRICDVCLPSLHDGQYRRYQDPRQFVPPSGQSFTTLPDMQSKYENHREQDPKDKRVWGVCTVPKEAVFPPLLIACSKIPYACSVRYRRTSHALQTDHGNILWDLITFLDKKTIDWISQPTSSIHSLPIPSTDTNLTPPGQLPRRLDSNRHLPPSTTTPPTSNGPRHSPVPSTCPPRTNPGSADL